MRLFRPIVVAILVIIFFVAHSSAAERENPLVRTAQYLQEWTQSAERSKKPPLEKTLTKKPRAEKENPLVRTATYLENWARPAPFPAKKQILRAGPVRSNPVVSPAPQRPAWTIVIFSDADEKTAAIQRFFTTPFPENVELLVESPVGASAHYSRVISRPAAHSESLTKKIGASFPERLTSFLAWAKANTCGKYVLFIINTPESADMLATAQSISRAALGASFRADVAFVSISGLGNGAAIQELRDLSRYLIVPEFGVPPADIPVQRLFSMMREPTISPREFAKVFPRTYVEEYAHGGSMAIAAGGYYVVGLAAIDTLKLATTVMPKSNMSEEDVLVSAGYPAEIADESVFSITLSPDKARAFEARIEAYPYGDREKVVSDSRQHWNEINRDLKLPDAIRYDLKDIGQGENLRREFIVQGDVTTPMTFRPWLPGAHYVILTTIDNAGRSAIRHYAKDKDYVSVESFPETSFLVSEAHSQGVLFAPGIKERRSSKQL